MELACDALHYERLAHGSLTPSAQALWDRMQPLRHGDYGGRNSIPVSSDEVCILLAAIEAVTQGVGLDDDERDFETRLRASLI